MKKISLATAFILLFASGGYIEVQAQANQKKCNQMKPRQEKDKSAFDTFIFSNENLVETAPYYFNIAPDGNVAPPKVEKGDEDLILNWSSAKSKIRMDKKKKSDSIKEPALSPDLKMFLFGPYKLELQIQDRTRHKTKSWKKNTPQSGRNGLPETRLEPLTIPDLPPICDPYRI